MPEKGGHSLTIRKETALRARELARNKGLTVDELINELMTKPLRGVWLTCSLCGASVKEGNMPKQVARVHPKTMRR